MCFSVVYLCMDESCFMGIIFDLDHHHPTQIYSEYFHFITIFWIINVVFLINQNFIIV